MKQTLTAIVFVLAITSCSCYTIKSTNVHNVNTYIVKQRGVKMLVTQEYTRIVTIDTLKK
jgi:uncharacterized protein YxeA